MEAGIVVTSRISKVVLLAAVGLVVDVDLLLVEGGLAVLDRRLQDDGQVGFAALVVAGVFLAEWLTSPRRG